MKRSLSVLLAAASLIVHAQGARVENVRAAQRPRSNVVEVFYDLVAPEGGVYDVALAIGGGGAEPPLSTLGGDWGADVIPGRNKKIEWDAGADWAQHVGSNLVATVTATRSTRGSSRQTSATMPAARSSRRHRASSSASRMLPTSSA